MGLLTYYSPPAILDRFKPSEYRSDPLSGSSNNNAITAFRAARSAAGGPARIVVWTRTMIAPQLDLSQVSHEEGSSTSRTSGIQVTSTSQNPFQRHRPHELLIPLGENTISDGAHIYVPSSSGKASGNASINSSTNSQPCHRHPTLYSTYWQTKTPYPSTWRAPSLPPPSSAGTDASGRRTRALFHRTNAGRVTKSQSSTGLGMAQSWEPVLVIHELKSRPASTEVQATSAPMRWEEDREPGQWREEADTGHRAEGASAWDAVELAQEVEWLLERVSPDR